MIDYIHSICPLFINLEEQVLIKKTQIKAPLNCSARNSSSPALQQSVDGVDLPNNAKLDAPLFSFYIAVCNVATARKVVPLFELPSCRFKIPSRHSRKAFHPKTLFFCHSVVGIHAAAATPKKKSQDKRIAKFAMKVAYGDHKDDRLQNGTSLLTGGSLPRARWEDTQER